MAIVTRALVRNSDGLVENMILVEEGEDAPSGYSLLDISASGGDTWNGSAVVRPTVEEIVNPYQTRYDAAAVVAASITTRYAAAEDDAARIAILHEAAANDTVRIDILAEMAGLTT